MDYENYESELTVREEKLNGYKTVVASNVVRWLIYFSIAICTAAVGIFIDTVIEHLCSWKYQSIRNSIDVRHSTVECLIVWLLFTVIPTTVGCSVVLFMEVYYTNYYEIKIKFTVSCTTIQLFTIIILNFRYTINFGILRTLII